jgi:ATP-dependent RNA helicase DDX5/DBP2
MADMDSSDETKRIKKEKKLKKKRERDDDDSVDAVPKKSKRKERAISEDSSDMPRRRTRSMSDAEEQYRAPAGLSLEEFKRINQITITSHTTGFQCPEPMIEFSSTPFAAPIRRALDSAGFPNATPTQAIAWPIALAGSDIITVAKTGSGKTCGFLLPAFHLLLKALETRRRGAPGILVLAPTRELACQIEEEAVKFGRSSNIRSGCAYGGAPKSLQIRKIQAGLEVLIATPGRLNDLIEMKVVNLSQVLFLVLDEADRMLDMGFEVIPGWLSS